MPLLSFTHKRVPRKLPTRLSVKMVQNPSGFTLIELLLCILLMGIIARIILPTMAPYREGKIELAATDIAMALRFARDEALRNGEERAVKINNTTGQVTVYRPNLATSPATVAAVLPNPLTKQPYDFNIVNNALTAGIRLENSTKPFKYRNNGTLQEDVFFDNHGIPVFINGAQRYQLESGSVQLGSGGGTRSVVLVPFTGRVTIQ